TSGRFVIDGGAANFQAPGPNVPMIATGSPLAAETIVVEPGAPRISTSPPARAPMAALPAAITTKLTCSPCFSKSPASLAIQSGIRLPVTEAYDAFSVSSGCPNVENGELNSAPAIRIAAKVEYEGGVILG